MSAYREMLPPPALRGVVQALWTRHHHAATPEHRDVLPDGCIDIVVWSGKAMVAGPDTRPNPTVVQPGADMVGVRFHPGAAAAVLGVSADALRDLRVPLEDIWGRVGRELGECAAGGPAALVDALLARIAHTPPPDREVLHAARRLRHSPSTPLEAVAAEVALGERQLRRRFHQAVGYGPKRFARIARFQRMLALLHGGDPLAAIAAEAGYADQAHMTREAAALGGKPPGRLLA